VGARHPEVEGYRRENADCVEGLTAPHDGAIFYTNGARSKAVEYARSETAAGRRATTLEGVEDVSGPHRAGEAPGAYGTPQGARLDADHLFDNTDPATMRFNAAERERQQSRGGALGGNDQAGAFVVFGEASHIYAQRASGRVEVFANGDPIRENSFFARHERDTLIRNEKVTEINGVKRENLAAILDRAGDDQAEQARARAEINALIEKGDRTRANRVAERNADSRAKAAAGREAAGPASPWKRHSGPSASAPSRDGPER
jgi:hypothetical protein